MVPLESSVSAAEQTSESASFPSRYTDNFCIISRILIRTNNYDLVKRVKAFLNFWHIDFLFTSNNRNDVYSILLAKVDFIVHLERLDLP